MPIKCPHCGREFPGDKLNARHLSICNPESRLKVEPCLWARVHESHADEEAPSGVRGIEEQWEEARQPRTLREILGLSAPIPMMEALGL
jgi:hypothetical protein